MRRHRVRCLLMGGQACILYGAAEFSRDVDLAVLVDPENLQALAAGLAELNARPIAVPPLTTDHLRRGHAVHFRCAHPEAERLRIDLLAVMRGVDPFEQLWERRNTVETAEGDQIDVMGLPDLVRSKKTQPDKDWPMIRRLLEAHYFAHRDRASPEEVAFWLRELRTPALLTECAQAHPAAASNLSPERPLIEAALRGDDDAVSTALRLEEQDERERDRVYWGPLKRELEQLRQQRK